MGGKASRVRVAVTCDPVWPVCTVSSIASVADHCVRPSSPWGSTLPYDWGKSRVHFVWGAVLGVFVGWRSHRVDCGG